jgi:predicted nucleotidyltransferase component of viral defense system
MLDNQLLELITATSEQLDLEDSVIEKDYFVTQVIHALSKIENEYFRLLFCGGTCLSKAHKIVNRMSEDVDFKIQLKKIDANLSKTKFLKELKEFRSHIRANLTLPA